MKKRLLALTLAASLSLSLVACGGGSTPSQAPSDGEPVAQEAVYTQLYASEVTTFNYLYTGNTNDLQMSANCVDCLVEYDNYGVMIPSLAERWEANEDNTE